MKQLFQVFCLVSFLVFAAKAQNCKVLLPSLTGTYEGECRNDKANGMGKAVGIDSYKGTFKNGYPEGQGKYTWKNGNWYEGNFKSGKRSGEGKMHYLSASNPDSTLAGFWLKDIYVGIYEVPFKIQSKGFMVKSVQVSPDTKQEPTQIMIDLSSVMSGSDDMHGTIPKPVLSSIDIKKGSFLSRSDVTNMNKRNVYYLINVIFPFSAAFQIGDDEVVIDFNNSGSYKVEIVMNQ